MNSYKIRSEGLAIVCTVMCQNVKIESSEFMNDRDPKLAPGKAWPILAWPLIAQFSSPGSFICMTQHAHLGCSRQDAASSCTLMIYHT